MVPMLVYKCIFFTVKILSKSRDISDITASQKFAELPVYLMLFLLFERSTHHPTVM